MVTWSGDFAPERFAVPATGVQLQKMMKELKTFAEEGDPGQDVLRGEDVALGLPKSIVDAAMALAPMHRASLIALLAGSLANELDEAEQVVDKLAMIVRAQQPARPTRKRRS